MEDFPLRWRFLYFFEERGSGTEESGAGTVVIWDEETGEDTWQVKSAEDTGTKGNWQVKSEEEDRIAGSVWVEQQVVEEDTWVPVEVKVDEVVWQ